MKTQSKSTAMARVFFRSILFVMMMLPLKTRAAGRWNLPLETSWHIQYTDWVDIYQDYQIYNLDLFDTSAENIDLLKQMGKKVICYFSAGTHEKWRPDAWNFPWEAVGRRLRRWRGERWLDTSKRELLRPVMEGRIALAKQKGCDAVDPDNVDGHTNPTGFDINYQDSILYSKMIADLAHQYGLAIGLKNSIEIIPEVIDWFDFAVNESCYNYNECEIYKLFQQQGKPVYQIQYGQIPENFCQRSLDLGMSSIIKGVRLDAWSEDCF